MLLPLLIGMIGLLMVGLCLATRSRIVTDVCLFLTAGSCLGAPMWAMSLGPLPVTLGRLMLGGIVIRASWIALRGQVRIPRPTAIDLTWLGYLAIATLSLATTDYAFWDKYPISLWLFYYVLPTMVYVVTRTVEFDSKDLKIAAYVLMAFGGYLAATSICEARGWHSIVFPRYIVSEAHEEFFGRGRGPFLNPVANGIAQTACLVVGILCWPRVSPLARLGLSAYYFLLLLGIYFTYTRSCWLGCVIAVGLAVWSLSNWRLRFVVATWGVLALLIGGLLAVDAMKSFKRDKYVTEAQMAESVSLRPMLAVVAFEVFQQRPVFGVGLGQYKKWDEEHLTRGKSELPLQKVGGYVQHNSLLASLAELGILGFTLHLSFILVCTWQSLQLLRRGQRFLSKAFGVLSISLIATLAFNSMFHDVTVIDGLRNWLLAFAGFTANLFQCEVLRPEVEVTSSVGVTSSGGHQGAPIPS